MNDQQDVPLTPDSGPDEAHRMPAEPGSPSGSAERAETGETAVRADAPTTAPVAFGPDSPRQETQSLPPPVRPPPQMPPVQPPPPRAIPVTPPAPPPKKSNSRGCLVAALLFGGILVISIGVLIHAIAQDVLNVAPGFSDSTQSRVREEAMFDDASGAKKIAVIDVKGVITQSGAFDQASVPRIIEEIKTARENEHVVGVILDMNTPGGEVTASDEIHHALQRLRRKGKVVVTCMRSVGASGGYYVAAGTDYIIANRLTLTGSVGVIIGTINYTDLFTKFGLETETYKSGALKDMLSGGRKRTDAEREYVQQLVDNTFMEFAAIVADGREAYETAEAVRGSEFGDGRILTGTQALQFGLVDELGFFEDAVARARELTGVPNAKIVRLRKSMGILDLLMSVESKSDGAVGLLLPTEWQCIQPGRLYYLMPTAVP